MVVALEPESTVGWVLGRVPCVEEGVDISSTLGTVTLRMYGYAFVDSAGRSTTLNNKGSYTKRLLLVSQQRNVGLNQERMSLS